MIKTNETKLNGTLDITGAGFMYGQTKKVQNISTKITPEHKSYIKPNQQAEHSLPEQHVNQQSRWDGVGVLRTLVRVKTRQSYRIHKMISVYRV